MADGNQKVLWMDPGTGEAVVLPVTPGAVEWKHTVGKKLVESAMPGSNNVFGWFDFFEEGPEGDAARIQANLEHHLREMKKAMARVIQGDELLETEGVEGFDPRVHVANLRIIQQVLDAAVEAAITNQKKIEELTSKYPTDTI